MNKNVFDKFIFVQVLTTFSTVIADWSYKAKVLVNGKPFCLGKTICY
jgi:hypothetical protein